MDILADENIESEWVHALLGDGHDVVRVADAEGVRLSDPDSTVLDWAIEDDRVLLTADKSDFSDPRRDDHAGIVLIADVTRAGGDLQRAIRRIDDTYPDLTGHVVWVSDWL